MANFCSNYVGVNLYDDMKCPKCRKTMSWNQASYDCMNAVHESFCLPMICGKCGEKRSLLFRSTIVRKNEV